MRCLAVLMNLFGTVLLFYYNQFLKIPRIR